MKALPTSKMRYVVLESVIILVGILALIENYRRLPRMYANNPPAPVFFAILVTAVVSLALYGLGLIIGFPGRVRGSLLVICCICLPVLMFGLPNGSGHFFVFEQPGRP